MVVVQVYDKTKSLTTNGFQREFCKLLDDLDYEVKVREVFAEVDRESLLLVLCHIWSTVANDINAVTEELKKAGHPLAKVIVVVVHEKEKHALPALSTRKTLGIQDDYENFGLIVDLAYTTSSKIYNCKTNDTGKNLLKTFIESNSTAEAGWFGYCSLI